ncbi:hypothetical protein CTI12_AA073660 [Artemisia annua]|uniref:Uncharacterized protein n=1 Tax=Artemisia annua TaxID=35608 RepID=A0A2U1Q5F6_ARTAN|nr:hypothetical protein CTI12_AA073660 [Artemisia annua]
MAIFDLNESAVSVPESSGNLSNCLVVVVCDNSGNISGSSYADVAADSIEVHATRVYTRKLFVLVQKEIIFGSWLCSIMSKTCDELCDVSVIFEEKLVPGTIPEVVDEDSTSENIEE